MAMLNNQMVVRRVFICLKPTCHWDIFRSEHGQYWLMDIEGKQSHEG